MSAYYRGPNVVTQEEFELEVKIKDDDLLRMMNKTSIALRLLVDAYKVIAVIDPDRLSDRCRHTYKDEASSYEKELEIHQREVTAYVEKRRSLLKGI